MTGATLVLIEWVDSRRPNPNWQRLAGFKPDDPAECVSVGFLVGDGEKTKSLAPNIADIGDDDNMSMSGVIHIPACCIKRIVPLEEVPDRPSH